MFQAKCPIISHTLICGNFRKLIIKNKAIAEAAQPGQFLNIRVDEDTALLLRRPLSIHDVSTDKIEMIYKVVGRGTEKLALKKEKDFLDVIGPLGNGYTLTEGKVILTAGGTGVASLLYLAKQLIKKFGSVVTVLIGGKTKEQVLCAEDFTKIGCAVKICTDDGTLGFKGTVTRLLKEHLSIFSIQPKVVYACGPLAMLSEITALTNHFKIPCEVSLEEHLGCGVGACMGCVVKISDGKYARVCHEGPVFDAKEVMLK